MHKFGEKILGETPKFSPNKRERGASAGAAKRQKEQVSKRPLSTLCAITFAK